MAGPGFWSIALRSLRFYWRSHAALALGVAAATAVIVGALVVGDTVRLSLKRIVTERLANIDALLHARVFFDPASLESVKEDGHELVPGILFSSTTLEVNDDGTVTRASQVQTLAPVQEFWKLSGQSSVADVAIGLDEVAVNQALADELGVKVGSEITLVMTDPSGVPSDNPLGKREDRSIRLPRQKVVSILPDASVGGVGFVSGQQVPRNVFANLETLQDLLEVDQMVNSVLVVNKSSGSRVDGMTLCNRMNDALNLKLEDFGLSLEHHRRVFPDPEIDRKNAPDIEPETIYDYYQLSADDLIIDPLTEKLLINEYGFALAERTLTYVANTLAKIEPMPEDLGVIRIGSGNTGGLGALPAPGKGVALVLNQSPATTQPLSREVPYSIVLGIRSQEATLGLASKIKVPRRQLRTPYCWVTSWLADQIDVEPGDWVQMKFFEPETVDGKELEIERRFMVAGIVPLTEPETPFNRRRQAGYSEAPTAFNDSNLTPSVPGVTDQESISDWDVPFELNKNLIKPVDDEYWRAHRLTPKVYLPFNYASNDKLFGSRFGKTTAIRFDMAQLAAAGMDETALRTGLEKVLLGTKLQKGLWFEPVRQRQMQAAAGTTPFDVLFLSLSFFVIVSALLLVYLLFRLSIQRRQSELGVLQSQGFTKGAINRLLASEFGVVALVGALSGIALGVAYARGIIAGLESWWIGAISSNFLHFFASPLSLTIGAGVGFLCSLLAIMWGLRKAGKWTPLSNLRGTDEDLYQSRPTRRIYSALATLALVSAIGLSVFGFGQTGIGRAGMFFGSGALLLTAALLIIRQVIQPSGAEGRTCNSVLQMAWRAIGRNPSRSILAVSLLAVAAFLIASMGVFQLSPTQRGYGGFEFVGQSSQPIYRNIGSAGVRSDVLGPEAKGLRGTSILPMRARFGEDASCNNLFQTTQPTILGVPDRLAELHDLTPESVAFDWAATAYPDNPWLALEKSAMGSQFSPIPVVLDQNTAMWSLKQGGSLESIIEIEINGKPRFFVTVGLLSNSVLQGKLMISEKNFVQLLPELSGYSFFLAKSKEGQDPQEVAELLEKGWSNAGLDMQYSEEILKGYLGVQNTYISAFQSLGALGLLLGTFGLIAVQVRSVLERQREFAVMRAIGFPPNRIATLLSWETIILLGGGVFIGVLCAAIALIPYVIEVQPALSFFNPLLMLGVVLIVGLCAALLAIRASNRKSILEGLRTE